MKSSSISHRTITSRSKCKNSRTATVTKKQALSSNGKPVLNRTTFKTSREMDFFSEKELTTQTGHEIAEWPLVILKELADNALDACEEADVAPVITVSADASGITVSDNGPGLPDVALNGALDFTVRASSREAYVSPCRGAQGNALKTLLPMPYVIDPEHGRFMVRANGTQHVISCGADPISQRPAIHDDVTDDPKCKNSRFAQNGRSKLYRGTEVRIQWGEIPVQDCDDEAEWPFDGLRIPLHSDITSYRGKCGERFRSLVEGFAVFNPHAAFQLDWFGTTTVWRATNPKWEKWKPNKPTSSHWYEPSHFERLIGAYITHDREQNEDRLVSDLVAEFDGLSGSQKRSKVLEDSGLKRVNLSALVVHNKLDTKRIGLLLAAMKRHTRSVNPRRLGVIGEDHLRTRLLAMGVQESSFRYSRKIAKDGLPWVLESAFGWLGPDANDDRKIYSGANFSAAIKNPFRSFGSTGEGLETVLADMRATRNEPVVFVLHLTHPRVEYTDRGKSALIVGGAA